MARKSKVPNPIRLAFGEAVKNHPQHSHLKGVVVRVLKTNVGYNYLGWTGTHRK